MSLKIGRSGGRGLLHNSCYEPVRVSSPLSVLYRAAPLGRRTSRPLATCSVVAVASPGSQCAGARSVSNTLHCIAHRGTSAMRTAALCLSALDKGGFRRTHPPCVFKEKHPVCSRQSESPSRPLLGVAVGFDWP